jgi:hypothetical protein
VPPGFTEGSATLAELQAAGFHRDMPDAEADRPGKQPLSEFLVEEVEEWLKSEADNPSMTPAAVIALATAHQLRKVRDSLENATG